MEKIYKGMPNGAEAVDGNFTELDGSVVHKKGDETISGDKKFTDSVIVKDMQVTKKYEASKTIYNGAGQINFVRIGQMVQVNVRSVPTVPVNTRISGVIPVGYRPPEDFLAGTKTGNLIYCYPDGAVGSGSTALASGDGYFSTSWPTMDVVPAD
ncbi:MULTISPECIES: hypothetical protein [Lactococcus]|jgi:hypothetical protein|uniref:hypothetical protein n=1 Tax=Lactococcus TaxID=1357 RepID=UPI0022E61F52|nr:hypothetical protein [Lactococcus petauri]